MSLNLAYVNNLIKDALDEDLGELGDITSNLTVKTDKIIDFQISNREDIILCGSNLLPTIFKQVSERLKINIPEITTKSNSNSSTHKESTNYLRQNFYDGDFLAKNSVIFQGKCNARVVFAVERLALNLIQHLSGISTITNLYVSKVDKNSKTKILDTRKTLPNLRLLQKYAVKIGGGENHRAGLYDMILIKDNHIAAAGSVENAIKITKEKIKQKNSLKNLLIEVECDTLEQVQKAAANKPNIIMLDNMNLEQIRKAQEIIANRTKIEVSGNINLEKIRDISMLNIDYISVGSLTHSVKAVDIGLDIIDDRSE
jgi:nicotinate-nucleotide pyrophosphorylase